MPEATTLNWSLEAEQSVLGALLLDNTAMTVAEELLSAADFFDARHGHVFSAISALVGASKPADTITVWDRLRDSGLASAGLTLEYVNALAECVPSAAHVRQYAGVVREKNEQRRLLAEVDGALAIARGPGTAAEKLDRITASLVALERGVQRRAPQRAGDLLRVALERYEAVAEGREKAGLATGIGPLDRILTGGLRPGKLYGIAARPGVGKSSFARTLLLHVAKAGAPALLLSQEMPAEELADALVAEAGRINGTRLQTGQFDREDWGRMLEAAETLRTIPLHVDDQGGLTLAQIRAKARQVKGLKVLALDYLQLCTSTLRGKSTNDEVAEVSRGLKALALEMRIAVIVLSQLNRAVEARADREPQLSDLRDSGAIEQDLDVAALLWTAREDDSSDGDRLVGVKVAKHRGGRKGTFALRWRPAVNQWRESDESLRGSAGRTDQRPARGFK
jgi:replicative DNA helicase